MKEGLFIERKRRHLYQIPNETFVFTGEEGWVIIKQKMKNALLFTIILTINTKNFKPVVLKEELELLIENDVQSFFVQYFNKYPKTSHENVLKLWIVISFPYVKK